VYCRPRHDCDDIYRHGILRLEEIHRIVRLLAGCGIDKIRLTGGEPLVRKNITALVARLAATPGIRELALTTNGVLLAQMAGELKAAGLDRVNVSIDSMEAESYRRMTGYDFLSRVVDGVHKALDVGLQPVKINAVILRGANYAQIAALARMSIDLPVTVRFIEYCPTNKGTPPAADYVPYNEIRRIIERTFGPLVDATIGCGNGPALYFKIPEARGAIGFIAGRSTMFCGSCNRLRMTSDGKIRPCLYSPSQYDVRKLLRSGVDDEQILNELKRAIAAKNEFTRQDSSEYEFSMRRVGG
jgi:cyclic pyranopterin phosphate synthase